MPAATKYQGSNRGEEPDISNGKGVSWGKCVDEKEKDDHPVIENLVASYDQHGEAKDVLYLKEFKGKFKNKNPSKVVVKVEASTVSRMDCQIRRNVFHHHIETPHVPGSDMVGTIIQVGTKAKRYGFTVGDRVCALDLNLGGNARYVVVGSWSLIKVPPALDAAEVACLIRTYVTAYQCLHRAGDTSIRRGDKVLVIGGSGCIGQAVIQLAKAAGATEIYATAGEGAKGKHFIESLGAVPVGRQSWQWLPIIEGQMDIVIDSVCDDGFESSHKALNRHGKLVILGDTSRSEQGYLSYFLSQHKLHFNLLKAAYTMERTTIYDLIEEYNEYPDQYERDLRLLFRMLEEGEIDPKIVKCIPLNEVANAHKEIEEGGVGGAIVCVPFISSVTKHEKKQTKPIAPKSSRRETGRDALRNMSPHREMREEENTSRGKNTDCKQRKNSKFGIVPNVTLSPPSGVGLPKKVKKGSSERMVPEERAKLPTASVTHTNQPTKKLQTAKKAQTEAKRTKAEEAEARNSEMSRRGSLGGEKVEEVTPKGILKESSYFNADLQKKAEAKKDQKTERKLSIDMMIHGMQRKAADVAAAEIQAKKLEAEMLKVSAEAKRAEAEALKAKVQAKKAELALLKGK